MFTVFACLFVAASARADGIAKIAIVPPMAGVDAGIDVDGDTKNDQPNVSFCGGVPAAASPSLQICRGPTLPGRCNTDHTTACTTSATCPGSSCSLDSTACQDSSDCPQYSCSGSLCTDGSTSCASDADCNNLCPENCLPAEGAICDPVLGGTDCVGGTCDTLSSLQDGVTRADEQPRTVCSGGTKVGERNCKARCAAGLDMGERCSVALECDLSAAGDGGGSCDPNYDCPGGTCAAATVKRINPKKSKCQLSNRKIKAQIVFENAPSEVDTDANASAAGVCDKDGSLPCTKDRNCKTKTGDFGPCLSGDEYWLEALVMVGSNADDGDNGDHQSCTKKCMMSFSGLCEGGVCAGGTRDGEACLSLLGSNGVPSMSCPGGFCNVPSSFSGTAQADTTPPDADELEATIGLPFFGSLPLKVHCPIMVGVSVPFEVVNGKGKVRMNLDKISLAGITDARVPPVTPIELKGCFVHDQAGDKGNAAVSANCPVGRCGMMSHTRVMGVLNTASSTASAGKTQCPSFYFWGNEYEIEAALGGASPINVPVSPIIGVSGVTGGKIKCTADGDCKNNSAPVCCSGECLAGPC